ncbi:MAG TPA: HDOD domain-containing protein [Solirubrobacter sp.]|nr:HDOD domain-containing protein [Solirubrobacter sp.]
MARTLDTRVHDALRRIGPLPVLSGTVATVRAVAADPEGSTGALVAAIEADEAFAANLLRYANSAAHARPIRARTIRQAVTLLGRRALARMALESATYRFLERFPGGAHLSRGQLHVHAVSVAAYACTCAELTGAHADTAHLAGLLHDVGKLLMPAAFGVAALEEITAAEPAGAARAALERKRLGIDHATAGALLVGLSACEDEVTRAIAYHHGGATGRAAPTPEAAAVQVADALAHLLAGGETDRALLRVALDRLDADLDLLDEVAERAGVPRPELAAGTDDLTGLPGRDAWLDPVTRSLDATVLVCAVDGLAAHGVRAGDAVLTEVARVLARHGVAGRLGDDTFGLLVSGDPREAAAAIEAALDPALGVSLAIELVDDRLAARDGRGV